VAQWLKPVDYSKVRAIIFLTLIDVFNIKTQFLNIQRMHRFKEHIQKWGVLLGTEGRIPKKLLNITKRPQLCIWNGTEEVACIII
jgi:hypothetical protein